MSFFSGKGLVLINFLVQSISEDLLHRRVFWTWGFLGFGFGFLVGFLCLFYGKPWFSVLS